MPVGKMLCIMGFGCAVAIVTSGVDWGVHQIRCLPDVSSRRAPQLRSRVFSAFRQDRRLRSDQHQRPTCDVQLCVVGWRGCIGVGRRNIVILVTQGRPAGGWCCLFRGRE